MCVILASVFGIGKYGQNCCVSVSFYLPCLVSGKTAKTAVLVCVILASVSGIGKDGQNCCVSVCHFSFRVWYREGRQQILASVSGIGKDCNTF